MTDSDFIFHHDAVLSPLLAGLVAGALFLVVRQSRARRRVRRERQFSEGLAVETEQPLPWKRGLLSGIGLASAYLLIFRLLSFLPSVYRDQKGGALLMSVSFLFLGPLLAGAITVAQGARQTPLPVRHWIMAPWIPVLLNVLLALAIRWEGIICVVFIVPPALISASLGGVLGGLLHSRLHHRAKQTLLPCLAVLPLVLALVETSLHQPLQVRQVNTSIRIHASPAVVWRNIERVAPIQRAELRPSWANRIGFPRPIEATLSREGVGGVRNASFERGLSFTETVTDWLPKQRLAFSIRANTAAIPATTLDEHVTVGGRFFDVLDGLYELEPSPNDETVLHLSSRERLSTDFNLYAALWSDAVMHDMQSNILHVLQQRCEQQERQSLAMRAGPKQDQ